MKYVNHFFIKICIFYGGIFLPHIVFVNSFLIKCLTMMNLKLSDIFHSKCKIRARGLLPLLLYHSIAILIRFDVIESLSTTSCGTLPSLTSSISLSSLTANFHSRLTSSLRESFKLSARTRTPFTS